MSDLPTKPWSGEVDEWFVIIYDIQVLGDEHEPVGEEARRWRDRHEFQVTANTDVPEMRFFPLLLRPLLQLAYHERQPQVLRVRRNNDVHGLFVSKRSKECPPGFHLGV